MEEDAAIIWDSELNAEFFDEDAAPSMPPSSRADGDSAITPAAQKSAKPTVASASKQATAIPKTAAVRGSSAAPASASATRSATPATRSRGSAKSTPRVRRFLYPAASQIARDTPDRRRLPRPALHTPVSAERRRPAAADTALTPAEQRDVQACLETAMETLDDDADTFFTQCRVSRADCEGSLQANSVTPSKTLSVQAQRQAVLDGAKGDGVIPMETDRTTGDVSLRKSSMQASSKSVHPHTITPRETPGSSSRASVPRHLIRRPITPLHTPGSVKRTATGVQQVKKHDLQNSSAPGPSAGPISGQSGTLSRPVPVSVSDHRTPAGRPAERVGRTAKRLWSAAAAAESEDDEPGCSPVLSSHKKRRRQDRRPAATPTSQSPMENVIQEHTITSMQEVVADDKVDSSTSRAPLDLAVLAKRGDIGEFAGFSTAAGRKLAVSEQAMQKAAALLKEVDAPSSDCAVPSTSASRNIVGASNDERLHGLPGAAVESPLFKDETRSHAGTSRRTELLKSDSEVGGAAGHGNKHSVGFQTASGKKLVISEKAVILARAKFAELEETAEQNDEVQRTNGERLADAQLGGAKTPSTSTVTDQNMNSLCPKKNESVSMNLAASAKRDVPNTATPCGLSLGERQGDGSGSLAPGFQTASGKKMTVSAKALDKAKALFENIDDVEACDAAPKSAPSMSTPSTARLSKVCEESGARAGCSLTASASDARQSATSRPSFAPPATVLPRESLNSAASAKAKYLLGSDVTEPLKDGGTSKHRAERSVGFATASGKAVAVSDAALKKAKAMLDSDLSEAVVTEKTTEPAFKHPAGFATASGKAVAVSGAALRKAKAMLDSDLSEPAITEKTTEPALKRPAGFATASGKAVAVSDAALKKAKAMLDSDLKEQGLAGETTEPAFNHPAGFATASGKCVAVSESAIKKAKALLDSDVTEPMMTEDSSESRVKRPAGFATASGKAVTVSNAALKRVKAMLDSGVPEESMAEKTTEPAFKRPAGFATASGKAVTVSEAALKKAKAMMESDLNEPSSAEEIAEPPMKRPVGFATASGKAVAVSDAALKKAIAMLDNDINEPVSAEKTSEHALKRPVGFATASGKSVAVSDAAIKKAKAMLDSNLNEHSSAENVPEPPMKRPAGFATASGKAVAVSDAALKKAKAILDSDVSETVKTENTPASGMKRPAGFATASGKSVAVSDAAIKKAKAMLDSNLNEPSSAENVPEPPMKRPAGFATASGKAVAVSDAALKKAKAMLDSDLSEAVVTEKTTEPAFKHPAGFATASGKAVAVSDAALKNAKAMLDSVATEETMAEKTSNHALKRPAGFATASGKSVDISDAALKKVKTLFDDDEHMQACPQEPEKNLGGFATAGGRHVQVSEDALKKARAKLNSDNPESHASTSTEPFVCGPSGFSTAAGKSVHISEDALRNAKAMLDGVEQSMETDDAVQKASTAGRRSGAVSEAALEEDRPPSEDEAIRNKENVYGTSSFDQNTRRGLKRDSNVLSRSIKDSNFSADASAGSSTSVTPDLAAVRRPKVRFLSCDAATRQRGDRQSDTSAPEPTVRLPSSSTAATAGSSLSRVSVLPGTAPPAAHLAASGATACGQGEDAMSCAGDEAGGLTQLLDDKFEFTQVVAERRQRAEEERSASPVLGSARRQRRRRTAEPAVFRTPYRSGAPPPPPIPSRAQPAEPAAASAEPVPASPAAPESPSAPQDTAGAGSKQETRASERRRQEARMTSGAERRVTRSVGSLMQCRLEAAAAVGTGRRSLRAALGQLPANLTRDELQSLDVPADVLNVTFTSAPSYRFKCTETTIAADGCVVVPADDDTVGVEEVRAALLSSPGVQPSLVPERWLENAYRHVVWKLAAYERQFPDEMAGRCLTAPQIVSQLRYRYDRELDRCQRPALRRITEGDDTAAKTLILCVAEVNTTAEGSARLLLSDGWYCIPAQGDAALERLVRLGRLRPGLKLAVHGAELTGQQEPCSPLEISADTHLRFSANSCRRARWDARLGYHSNPAPFASGLRAVLPDGGAVARLDAAVARVYPLLYYEKGDSGGVFLTTRCERRRAAAADAARDARLERMYADVERELGSQERPAGAGEVRRPVSRAVVRQLSTGQQIYECVAAAADPGSVESLLTDHQKSLAAEYQRHRQEVHRGRVETEFRARLEQEKSAHRPAAPLLKIRLAGRNNMPASGALLTLWRPSDELRAFLVEGKSVSLFGVAANGKRSGVLQLSSGGGQLRVQPGPPGLTAPPRVLAAAAGTRPPYGELDVAALVVRVTSGAGSSETVHLADRAGRLLSAVCWPGLKSLSLDGLVEPGARLAFSNLQLCSAPTGRPPLCSLSDRTEVSRRPAARHLIDELRMLTDAAADAEFETSARTALDAVLAAAPARPVPTSLCSPGMMGAAYCPVTPPACAPGPWSPAVTPGGPAGDGSAEASRSAPVRRLQALQRYGTAPPISPLAVPLPLGVRRPFRSPRPTAAPAPDDTAAPAPDETAASAAASAASEIIRLSRLEPPTEAAGCDSPPIEPESQLA